MALPPLAAEMEGVVNPRTCGSLAVHRQKFNPLFVAALNEIERVLYVGGDANKRNDMIVEGPLGLDFQVAHD